MRGKAASVSERGTRQLSNAQFLAYWRMAGAAVELTVRRLKWWQGVFTDPLNNTFLLSALFGQMRCEDDPQLGRDGRLTSVANPWAKRLMADVAELEKLDRAHWLVGAVAGQPLRLIHDRDLAAEFAAIDVSELRAVALSVNVAPPGFVAPRIEPLIASCGEKPWVCDFDCDGYRCEARFEKYRQLATHRQIAHGMRNILDLITITNVCPFREHVYSSKTTA